MRFSIIIAVAVVLSMGCNGCKEAPPFEPDVFTTPETIEEFGDSVCDPSIGIVAPLPGCYPDQVCDRVLPVPGRGNDPFTVPTHIPDCETDVDVEDHARRSDGGPLTYTDLNSVLRRYCLFDPAEDVPMPLVVWYHGSGGSADNVYDHTKLREKAETFDLGGQKPGFMLLSVEGRNLHWPTDDPRDGPHHDVFHRDLDNDSANRDISLADRLIDQLVDDGRVDHRRIYVMGWSNGMHFAQMYGIARHETPTARGNRVAAVAGYSAADPFHNRAFGQDPSCQLAEYPRSEVPILLLGRSCDAIPCSDAQYERAVDQDRPIAPGTSQEEWMRTLADRVGNPNARRVIIDDHGEEVSSCKEATKCKAARALINHVRWPDGVADGGRDFEPMMLDFLRENPAPLLGVEGD